MHEVDARGPGARRAHPARGDDRGPERGRDGRRLRARGRVLQPRHERSHPVHARHRSRQPIARPPRLALPPGHPAADPAGVARRPRRTRCRSRSAARWRAIRSRRCSSSASASASSRWRPRRSRRSRRRSAASAPAECERAAEAALALDTAEAVEELVAGAFAPSLFDLLTGTEDGSYGEDETGRTSLGTIPDR